MGWEGIYRKLFLIRAVEERLRKEYRTNDLKTPLHLAIGAEAIAVAVCEVFPRAKVFASYRNHHWYLAKGGDLKAFMAELYGKETGVASGKAGSMHMACPAEGLILTSAVVATQISPAIGYAFAQKYLGKDDLTIAVFGDGATEEGAFYESLNLAALYNLNILFVCEDNDLAIHQKKKGRRAFSLPNIVLSYLIHYEHYKLPESIDCAELIHGLEHWKDLKGPKFINVEYERFLEHVGPSEDYSAGYRDRPSGNRDPLCLNKWAFVQTPKEILEDEVLKEIDEAVQFAKDSKEAPVSALFEHVFEAT